VDFEEANLNYSRLDDCRITKGSGIEHPDKNVAEIAARIINFIKVFFNTIKMYCLTSVPMEQMPFLPP
jgi:hypothetical protein